MDFWTIFWAVIAALVAYNIIGVVATIGVLKFREYRESLKIPRRWR